MKMIEYFSTNNPDKIVLIVTENGYTDIYLRKKIIPADDFNEEHSDGHFIAETAYMRYDKPINKKIINDCFNEWYEKATSWPNSDYKEMK